MKVKLPLIILLLVAASGINCARADEDIAVNARQALNTYQNSLVVLRLTFKMQRRGQSIETKRDTIATVIDPSGLSVTALANVGGGDDKIDISEARMRLPDGTEIPVRVVLKDEDLGLAFIAPETALTRENSTALTVLPIADGAKVEPADECFLLTRMNKLQNFVPAIETGRIIGKRAIPRLIYLASMERMGCPVFDGSAKLIGFFTLPKLAGALETPVILPVAEVVKNVAQAKEEVAKPAISKAPPASNPATESKPAAQDKKE